MQKLLAGHVLSDIGYSPSLLSQKTLERVQGMCLAAKNIITGSLEAWEETQLRTGMAVTVRNVLKQRHARNALFSKDLIGLRNDLALRRELRKPLDKVRLNLFSLICLFVSSEVCIQLTQSEFTLHIKFSKNFFMGFLLV